MEKPYMLGRNKYAVLLFVALFAVACQTVRPATDASPPQPSMLVVASHNSFNVSEAVVTQFEEEHNVQLEFLALGDAGEMVNRLVLSRDAPLADVVFGVDNTFLSRALNADIFEPYASPQLEYIPDELELDPEHRLLPVDVGYVNLNADRIWFEENEIPLPQTLEELTDPSYRGLLVAPNPATSSPGLAFLLATISYFGEDGYLDFWQALRENDVLITDGWSEAYFEHFTVGSGGSGNRPLVVSYSTSPPADVVYATDGRTEPASVNINPPGGVFRQIEFAGILRGTQQPELARAWVDFMLSPTFQEDMPLQMFVYPARPDAQLPELFAQFAEIPAEPAEVDTADIEDNREQWIEAWTNVVIR
jgi:thiamine transport system substrate-binding protein